MLGQPVVSFARALLHAHLDDSVAHLLRRVENARGQRGLAILFGERHGVERFARIVVKGLGGDQPFVRHDLLIHASHAHVFAGSSAHDEAPRATDSEVDGANGKRPTLAAEPVNQVLGFGPGFEDQPAGRIENAHQHDLSVRRKGHNECGARLCACGHVSFSPWLLWFARLLWFSLQRFSIPPDKHPDDRSFLPRIGGSSPPSPRRS